MIRYQSADSLVLEFCFDKPNLQKHILATPHRVLLSAVSNDIQVKKISEQKQVENIESGSYLIEDIAIGVKGEIPSIPWQNDRQEIRILGTADQKTLFLYPIYPCQIHASKNELEWLESLTLLFTGKSLCFLENDSVRLSLLSKSVLQKKQYTGKLKSTAQFSSDQMIQSKQARLKIWIWEEGIYRIPQPMVAKTGWDISRMDPRYFRIVGSSGEILIRVVGEEDGSFDFYDYIEFYGEPLWDTKNSNEKRLDVYGDDNIYWLEYSDRYGLRMALETGWSEEGQYFPNSYLFTQHEEIDAHFNRLPYATDVDDGDYWFYSGPIVGGEKRSFSFDIHSPDTYSSKLVSVKIKLRGQSQSAVVHPIEIYLNDRKVGQSQWTGNSPILVESGEFSPFYLLDGTNTLTVANQSEEAELSRLLLDWFEIVYPREFRAQENYVRFHAPQESIGKEIHFKIEGFTSSPILLYKKNVSQILGGEVSAVVDSVEGTTYQLIFRDEVVSEQTEYLALTPEQIKAPDSVAFVEPSDLSSPDRGCDYILITPSDSLGEENLTDLIQLRNSQGLSVDVILVDEIYNVFNKGIPNPEAIRKFLKYTHFNWSPKPRFVLLIGDGYYNNRAPAEAGNLIPAPMYQTWKYGAAATDHRYTLLEGEDNYPDIAIGRLPVRTQTELRDVIQKIVEYEQSPSDPWKNQYLCIAAGGYSSRFMIQTETCIEDILPSDLHSERLYLSGDLSNPYVGGTEDLLRYFREGMAFINFRGHGGGAIWSDVGLLDLEDIELIENQGKLPFVTSMTCFTADFSSGSSSLGEALVCHEAIGAVAFWGATGVGWVENDYYLLTELYRIIHAFPDLTLGEMIQQAKTNYLMTHWGSIPNSEVFQFTLLGDPATRLAIPKEHTSVQLESRAIQDKDTLRIQGSSQSDNYHLLIEVTNHHLNTESRHISNQQESEWHLSIPLPETFQGDEGGVRTYLWDSETDLHQNGFTPFAIGKTLFDSLRIIPEQPESQDTVTFSVWAENPGGIDQIQCYVYSPFSEMVPMKKDENSLRYYSTKGVGPLEAGDQLKYFYIADNSDQSATVSDTMVVRIPSLAELSLQSLKMEGTEQVELHAVIQNLGETDAENVVVLLSCSEAGFLHQDMLTVEALSRDTLKVPFSSTPGVKKIQVRLNPDSTLLESRYDNNDAEKEIEIRYFNVTSEKGTTFGENSADTVGIPGACLCVIPPGTVSKKTALFVDRYDPEDGMNQDTLPALSYISYLSLMAFPENTELLSEAVLIFCGLPEDTANIVKLYHWNQKTGQWIFVPSELGESQIVAKSNRLGKFRFLSNEDIIPPVIELFAENQPLSSGSYVSKNGFFSVVVQDESGVDFSSDRFRVVLDGIVQEQSALAIPDSTNDPGNITVTFRPELASGNHTIRIEASDIHGNIGHTEEIHFQVSSHFDIRYLGNHPNPFKYETIFCYLLTDAAKEVSLRIFTVSGRLIRSFHHSEMNTADYHEVEWDGRDEWGNEIANGVYFFSLKAKGFQKNEEIKGKIAKIH